MANVFMALRWVTHRCCGYLIACLAWSVSACQLCHKASLGKVLVADSFFGSHDAAAMLSAQERPFLMLTSTSALVQDGNVGLDPGDVNTVVHKEHGYALSVYKNLKVGRKPAKVVPLLTNCLTGGSLPHRSGRYHLPGIIANYRRFAPGVDTFNQMCLQHREEHRFQSWWKALGGIRWC